jgi:hypothetical protein
VGHCTRYHFVEVRDFRDTCLWTKPKDGKVQKRTRSGYDAAAEFAALRCVGIFVFLLMGKDREACQSRDSLERMCTRTGAGTGTYAEGSPYRRNLSEGEC